MFDAAYIRKMIDECPFGTIDPDSAGVIHNPQLGDYIDRCAADVLEAGPAATDELVKSKILFELAFAVRSREITAQFTFFDLCTGVYNYGISEYPCSGQPRECYCALTRHMLSTHRAFLTALLSGSLGSAFVDLRQLYETYVILNYIVRHPELAQGYVDHRVIAQRSILKAFGGDIGAVETAYASVIDQYGPDFGKNYGWVEKKQDRSVANMARRLGMSGYQPLHRVASEIVHASSFFVHTEVEEGPYLMYLSSSAVEILTNGLLAYMRSMVFRERERILLMNVLYALREDLYDEPPGPTGFRAESQGNLSQ